MPTEGLTVSGTLKKVRLKSRGLSGEHIQLCAEGARRYAESLRQTDRDAAGFLIWVFLCSPRLGAVLFFALKEGYCYVRKNHGFYWIHF